LSAPGACAPFVAGDALRLPFADASFDAAVATNLLFLLPDPRAGLRELARVTRPGGLAGWLNPSDALSRAAAAEFCDGRGMTGFPRFSLINYARIAEGHHRFSGEAWAELARDAGLADVVTEGRGGGLMTIGKGIVTHG
jgi:ubiquinone/menaquinone biosynthesis C-methylase UbiE